MHGLPHGIWVLLLLLWLRLRRRSLIGGIAQTRRQIGLNVCGAFDVGGGDLFLQPSLGRFSSRSSTSMRW